MENIKKVSGLNFFLLAICAFAGLGTEVIYAFLIEPAIYGVPMQDWNTVQSIIHWIITCITWSIIAFILIKIAHKKYQFNLFEKSNNVKLWQWIVIFIGVVIIFVVSYKSWNGFKIVKEFQYNGWLKFIFQYIYYIVETALFTLIIVFGQKAFEIWFKNKNFPYGALLIALTWGLGHILTKDLQTGLYGVLSGFLFGAVYLLVNRDIKKTFLILLIMFIL